MATQPTTPRVPLLASLAQRGSAITSDARLINGYAEKLQDGTFVAVKRPGWSLNHSFGLSSGAGVTYWDGHLYAVVGDGTTYHLYKDGTSVGTITQDGRLNTFSVVLGTVPKLFIKNRGFAYHYDSAGGLVTITALADLFLHYGQAYLDATTYVLAGSGGGDVNGIRGSGINDLDTWDITNLILAQMMADSAVAIFRQLSYVVVVKEFTTEGFYDGENPTGSPLTSAPGTFYPYGILVAESLQIIDQTALWLATNQQGGRFIVLFENMQPKVVSTPAVERVLQAADLSLSNSCWSFTFRHNGHQFYGLTFKTSNITLVFDITVGEWYPWNSGGNYIPFIGMTSDGTNVIGQAENGDLYNISSAFTSDNGTPIITELYTPNFDGGTQEKKYLHRTDFLTDQASSGMLKIRVSDDDYQTWSSFRTLDLAKDQRSLFHCGTFRRRAWHVYYDADTSLRLDAIELSIKKGAG